MNTTSTFVILFCIATTVALVVPRRHVPYTVALVVAGLALGSLNLISPPHLTRELLFAVFLPGLLFEAAFNLDLTAFRRMWRSVFLLALPGVAASILLTAGLVWVGARVIGLDSAIEWRVALVFAAIVAATDPVAVTALFREMRMPARLTTLVEAESLFNDGTAIVFLSLVLSVVGGQAPSAPALTTSFITIAGGGVVVGALVGLLITRVLRRVNDAMIEIGLTTIAAFGAFALADSFGLSGVLATVVAAMVCARDGRLGSISPESHQAVDTFWQYVAFALNSIVFLLIGFEVRATTVGAAWREISIGFVAMLIARIIVIGLLAATMRRTTEHMPSRWNVVIAWGGLRGALSMVLALSLPTDFPGRGYVVAMTTGAVAVSIVLQGLSMRHVVRYLHLERIPADDPASVASPVTLPGPS